MLSFCTGISFTPPFQGGNRFWNSTLGEKYCVSEMTVEVGIFPNFPWLLPVDSFRCAYNRFEAFNSFLLAMLLAS